MNDRPGLYWLGAAGAFAVSWLACRSIASISSAPRVVEQRSSENRMHAQESNLNVVSSTGARRNLGGADLETAVREIASIARTAEETDARYMRRVFEFAASIPLKEFSRALELLKATKMPGNEKLRGELLAYWMEHDSKAAGAYFVALPRKEREGMVSLVADAWARVDSTGLLDWFKSLPVLEQDSLGASIRRSIADALAPQDPANAFALLIESSGTGRSLDQITGSIVFRYWAKEDPRVAAEGLAKLPSGLERYGIMRALVDEWMNADQTKARAWVDSITQPDLARDAATVLATRMINSDPGAALKYAVERGVAEKGGHIVGLACNRWVGRDAEGAMAWATSLPDSEARNAVLPEILSQYTKHDPERAAQMYLAELSRGTQLDGVSRDVLSGLLRTKGMTRVVAFLNELTQTEQVEAVSASYLLSDSLGADGIVDAASKLATGTLRDTWLEKGLQRVVYAKGFEPVRQALERLPRDEGRDAVANRLIAESFQQYPDQAAAFAQTLQNGHEAIMKGVENWLGSFDPTAARNWIQKTKLLTAAEKQQLLLPATTKSTASGSSPSGKITQPGASIPRP